MLDKNTSNNLSEKPSPDLNNIILSQIQLLIQTYLDSRPSLSLNALSHRCETSEPTLRLIMKGQIKTLPNASTILDILTTISGEKNIKNLPAMYPNPLSTYLKESLPLAQNIEISYDPLLNLELKHPTTYLIYKLASNTSGVKEKKVIELFGSTGLNYLNNLLKKGYIYKRDDVFYSSSKSFTSNIENFVQNFKCLADFIKTNRKVENSLLNPFFANYSNSVSSSTYKQIVKIQKEALLQIQSLMENPSSCGDIPLFLLLAVDTLDMSPASDFEAQ